MFTLVDDKFEEELSANPAAQGDWLILEEHPEFRGRWKVNCLDPHFFFDFKDLIGAYRTVSPASLEEFLDKADELQYKVAFFEDPADILSAYDGLHNPPDVTLYSSFDDTVNGFLPYQVEGYNMLKDQQWMGVARWSTGTGKTVLSGGLIKHHIGSFDTCFMVTKATNKVNTQRKLKKLAGVESEIIKGLKQKKELKKGTFYPRQEFYDRILNETDKVLICSYETFKVDYEMMLPLFEGRRVLIIWDEMPTKLKTRTTELYESVKHLLFNNKGPSVKRKFFRPARIRQYMLSATPIENSPEDWFNCVRLMDPEVYGTVTEFRNEFVASYSYFDETKPDTWQKLDKIGLMAAHVTHQVDKENDPEIRKQFPEMFEDTYYCEWTPADRILYNEVLDRCEAHGVNPLATINLLQMVCDEPLLLWDRAEVYAAYESAYKEWEEIGEGKEPRPQGSKGALDILDGLPKPGRDDRHGKQDYLRYLLLDKHYGEKSLVFSQLNNALMPTLERRFNDWGVRYVRYNGTERQRQAAEDAFMEDPNVWVFLSSDMGSDSLDLYNGKNVFNYNLPMKWTTKTQRANRVNRVVSTFEWNNVGTLTYSNSVEERKAEIIDIKRGYHDGVFNGKMAEEYINARMSKEELYYMLRGYDTGKV